MDTTTCPECGEDAKVHGRGVFDRTNAPIEHCQVLCAQHRFALPVARLARRKPARNAGPRSPGASPQQGGTRVVAAARRVRILLLCSAFNGLSQRAWIELREAGHQVKVQLAADDDAVRAAVKVEDPDLVICPFLRERVPAEIWSVRPTIVLHPGPKGDRGPSSLDWAVMGAEPVWGVTEPPTRGEAPREPGMVTRRRHGAVQVRTGDGAIWVGHLRSRADPSAPNLKLPATSVLDGLLDGVPEGSDDQGYREIGYRRDGAVGVLNFDFYNGAMSTEQCRRLEAALRHAGAQDTRVLLLRGGPTFSNGIHLGVIEAAADPASEAWANIVAIDDVCRQIITCTRQLVVASVAGNAGAGGVMLALGADRVLVRNGIVLNPHYRKMGLYGSEYWTYALPRRVGHATAHALTTRCNPIGSAEALRTGLADEVVHAAPAEFENAVARYAEQLADSPDYPALLTAKRTARTADEQQRPLRDYRQAELDQMWSDIVGNEHGFAEARRAFILKQRVRSTTSIRV